MPDSMDSHPPDATARLDQEFGRILEDSLNEIFIFDASTLHFIQVNRGARENLGYSMEELRGLTPIDLKPEFTRETFEALLRPLRDGDRHKLTFDTVHQRKNGTEYNVEVHLQLATFHAVPAFIAIILDTTERTNVANQLRVQKRAIESVGVGVVITDAQQRDLPIIFCNQAFQRITGYSEKEMLGRNCRFLQQDDRNQTARELLRSAVQAGRECRTVLRNYRKDGALFWNELTISPVKNLDEELTHFVGLVNDVTERVVAEEEKQDREARLRAILDTAVEAIITINERGICESINRSGVTMFGYTTEEVVGKNVALLMPSPYRDEHDDYLGNYLRTGQKKIIGIGREVVGRRKNGEEFPIHLAVSEVRLEHRRLFTGFIQDTTEQKEAERRLVQSERLAVLGEAMARLAHESRNSLQRIQIAVETARMQCAADTPVAAQLEAIEKSSDGLDSLLNEVKNYSAPLHLEKRKTTLERIWREAWQATAAQRSSRIVELREDVCTDALTCEVDYFRIGQVFRNLFENSLAACTDPTQITIRVAEKLHGQRKAWKISFKDNGPGLNPEQAARIFEPFFTTKVKGTGLGMAIAHRIVEAHEGTITVGPTDRGGAEFFIDLPQ
ncbi:MAG: PAS domain S-box protein [Bythopirellula sp.]